MANEVNIYTPRYLAEVVRQAPPVHKHNRLPAGERPSAACGGVCA